MHEPCLERTSMLRFPPWLLSSPGLHPFREAGTLRNGRDLVDALGWRSSRRVGAARSNYLAGQPRALR